MERPLLGDPPRRPCGRAILDRIEGVLGLDDGKLASSRHVLSQFGNMSGTTVIFVLDELRRRRAAKHDQEGEAPDEWGVVMAFGPGITIETMVAWCCTPLAAWWEIRFFF